MDCYPMTPRTRLVRSPRRACYDRALIHGIVDEAPLCHVGFVADNMPLVMPTTHWRVGEELMIHGARTGRMIRTLAEGAEACITISLIDGWVLARSAFHHSVNYRSVMLFGRARVVDDPAEKRATLDALIDRIVPGRAAKVRPPNEIEMKATTVLAFALSEVSAKLRAGPPADDEADLSWPVWAGVVPLSLMAGEPVADGVAKDGDPDETCVFGRLNAMT